MINLVLGKAFAFTNKACKDWDFSWVDILFKQLHHTETRRNFDGKEASFNSKDFTDDDRKTIIPKAIADGVDMFVIGKVIVEVKEVAGKQYLATLAMNHILPALDSLPVGLWQAFKPFRESQMAVLHLFGSEPNLGGSSIADVDKAFSATSESKLKEVCEESATCWLKGFVDEAFC